MGRQRNNFKTYATINSAAIRAIIVDGNAKTLVEQSEQFAKSIGRDLTTNQIRAIFGSVRQIEMNWDTTSDAVSERSLILLKPKMQYRAAKEGRRGGALKALADILSEAIDRVVEVNGAAQKQRFSHLVDFFEAILAYHKVAGGN